MPRKDIRSHPKYKEVMEKYKKGDLYHSSGYKIEDPIQARRVAANTAEPGRNNLSPKERAKKREKKRQQAYYETTK